MLTESNFHHHSHHSNGPIIAQHRTHYAPYPHTSKSIQQHQQVQQPIHQQQIQQQVQQVTADSSIPKFDLHHAVRTNDVTGIIRLHSRLRQQPSVAETCLLDSNGHTPLYTAIANGRATIVDLLLHLGHNPVRSFYLFSSSNVHSNSFVSHLLVLHLGES